MNTTEPAHYVHTERFGVLMLRNAPRRLAITGELEKSQQHLGWRHPKQRYRQIRLRSLVTLIGLAIGFAGLTLAQQNDAVDSQIAANIEALSAKYDETIGEGNPAAMAALFTDDGVYVTDHGPLNGREAIQKWYAGLYQVFPKWIHISKPALNASHVTGTTGDQIWTNGAWSATLQAKTGDPIKMNGYWSAVEVREGNTWKFRMLSYNISPGS